MSDGEKSMTPDEEGEKYFIDSHLAMAREVARGQGFAWNREEGSTISPEGRKSLIRGRMLQAIAALTDLSLWLEDDNAQVRLSARESIYRCLQVAYTGDRPEPVKGLLERLLHGVDHQLGRLLTRHQNLDAADPFWARPNMQRSLRRLGICVGVFASIATMAAFSFGLASLALLGLVVLGVADTIEGSFARVTRMKDPQLRWMSCICSHIGDIIVMIGMFGLLQHFGQTALAELVLVAAVISVAASLIRVSALQAGHRFWRSPSERVVRFGAFIGFSIACTSHNYEAGAIGAAILLIGFGVTEGIRVMHRVADIGMSRGGFIFFTSEGATCWSFEDEEDASPESTLFDQVEIFN